MFLPFRHKMTRSTNLRKTILNKKLTSSFHLSVKSGNKPIHEKILLAFTEMQWKILFFVLFTRYFVVLKLNYVHFSLKFQAKIILLCCIVMRTEVHIDLETSMTYLQPKPKTKRNNLRKQHTADTPSQKILSNKGGQQ